MEEGSRLEFPSPGREIAVLGHTHARNDKPSQRSAPVARPQTSCKPSEAAASHCLVGTTVPHEALCRLRWFDHNEFDAGSLGWRCRTLIGVAVVGRGNLNAFVSRGLRHFGQARDLGAVVSARPPAAGSPPSNSRQRDDQTRPRPCPSCSLRKTQARTTGFRRGALREGSTNRRRKDG